MTTAVALSGGVDSLLSLVLLREQGQDVLGVHARFLPDTPRTENVVRGLERTCRSLDIRLVLVDLRQAFEDRVVKPFINDYLRGNTPNPCAWCNKTVKFGLLLEAAQKIGTTRLATGHYALLRSDVSPAPGLFRGVDPVKEQSYFLSLLSMEQLAYSLFPLGGWHKSQVKQEALRRNLTVPAGKESQEICFVPHNDYRRFIEKRADALPPPGPVAFKSGRILGRHQGLWRYTLGQRRGLGIAHSEPLYVIGKDTASNTLLVGTRDELMSRRCTVARVNLLVPRDKWPSSVLVQTIYRHSAKPAEVTLDGQSMDVVFHKARKRATPGQVAAVYSHEGRVLAGGIVHG